MLWSDEKFRARVVARAAEKGVSVRELLTRAQVSLDILDKTPAIGRRVDTLEKIATACDWTLAQVMGFEVTDRIGSLDLLTTAVKLTNRALRHVPDREAAFPSAVMAAYNVLAERRENGLSVDDQTAIATLEATIAELWGAARPARG